MTLNYLHYVPNLAASNGRAMFNCVHGSQGITKSVEPIPMGLAFAISVRDGRAMSGSAKKSKRPDA